MISNKTELENLKDSVARCLKEIEAAVNVSLFSPTLAGLVELLRYREAQMENIDRHISMLENKIRPASTNLISESEEGLQKQNELNELDKQSVKEFAKIIHDAVILLADILFELVKAKQSLDSTKFTNRLKLQQCIDNLYSNNLLANQLRCQISHAWLSNFENGLMLELKRLSERERAAFYQPNYPIATTLYDKLQELNINQNFEEAIHQEQSDTGMLEQQQKLKSFNNFREHPTVTDLTSKLNKAQKSIKSEASLWQWYVSGYASKLHSFFKYKKRELNGYAVLLSSNTMSTVGSGVIDNDMQKGKLVSQVSKLKNKLQKNTWFQRSAIQNAKKLLMGWLEEFESKLNSSTTFTIERFVDLYKKLGAIKRTLEELDTTEKPINKYTHTNFYKEVVNAINEIEDNALDKPILAKSLDEANGVFNRGNEIQEAFKRNLLSVICTENEKKILYYANQSTTAISAPLVAKPLDKDTLQTCINEFQVETCKTNGFMRWVGKGDLRYAQIYMDLIEKTTEGELSRRIILFALLTNEKLGNRFKNHLAKHIAELQNYNISDNLVESVIKQLATSIKSAVCPDKNSEDHENHLKTVNTVVKELCRLSGRQATVEGNKVYQRLLETLNEFNQLNQPKNGQEENQVKKAMERANSQRQLRRQSSNLSSTDSTDMLANPTTEEISLATNETATDTEQNSGRHSSSFGLFTSNEQQISSKEQTVKDEIQQFKDIIINYKKNLCNKGAFLGLINSQNFLRAQAYSELLEDSTFELATMSIVYAALSSKQAGDFKYPLAIKAVTTYELKAANGLASTIEALKKKIDEQFDPVKTHYPENYLYTMVIAQITDAADKGYTLDDGFYVDALGKLELIKTSLANAKQERPTATQHRMEAPIINIVGPYGNS